MDRKLLSTIFLLAMLVAIPNVVVAGKPGTKPSGSMLTFAGDVTGTIASLSPQSAANFEGDETLYLEAEVFDVPGEKNFMGESEIGHLIIRTRKGSASFFFKYWTNIDGDDVLDSVALHSLGYSGEVVGKSEKMITFAEDTFEIYVAYMNADGTPKLGQGEGWNLVLSFTVSITSN
ncbi:hypothetical protein AC480_04615 [miscellaneous Crenarchaeota group archaeon SMTZ1-55]|nr:MAG: hypothetical protein AC480_04615 [miscellaneous Crenarchaeota group archaeon SMTZ1-55]